MRDSGGVAAEMTRKLFALVATVLMVGMVFGPGVVAGASAANDDAGNDETDDRDGNATDAFGVHVSAFVHQLVEDDNETNESLGQQISSYVTANNPGNASANAGPPENVTQGPPEDKGPDGNQSGRPEDAGPDGDQGPPDEAGSNDSDADSGNDGKARGKSG
jgi:hypothetical protein